MSLPSFIKKSRGQARPMIINKMHLYPLLFEQNLHEVVWGGNRLRPFKGLEPSDEPIGESWEVSAVPSSTSIISNRELVGKDYVQ